VAGEEADAALGVDHLLDDRRDLVLQALDARRHEVHALAVAEVLEGHAAVDLLHGGLPLAHVTAWSGRFGHDALSA
jgi:hypothetical protein